MSSIKYVILSGKVFRSINLNFDHTTTARRVCNTCHENTSISFCNFIHRCTLFTSISLIKKLLTEKYSTLFFVTLAYYKFQIFVIFILYIDFQFLYASHNYLSLLNLTNYALSTKFLTR